MDGDNPPPETPRAEKSKHVKVMEYAMTLAVRAQQLTQAQADTIMGLFEESEAHGPGDSFELKLSRFEKSMKARFGPKAGQMYEIVCEKRKETIAYIQARQQKRETSGDLGSVASSQDSLPRTMPSLSQNQLIHHQATPPTGHFQPVNGGHQQPQQQQHHGAMSYMSPSPPTLGGVMPQQQQQPHWQLQGTQSYYQMNNGGNNEHGQPQQQQQQFSGGGPMLGGGGGGAGGGGMGTLNPTGSSNPMFNNNNLLLQSMQPRPDMHHGHGGYSQQQQQNQHHHNPQQQQHQNQQQQRQNQLQQQQQQKQQQLQIKNLKAQQTHKAQQNLQQQLGGHHQQQPHNQHGGSGGGSAHAQQHPNQQQQHQQHSEPVALTPAEEIDRETERVRDLQSEGMEFSSDRSLTAPLVTGEFVRDEKSYQRITNRNSMSDHNVAPSVAAYGQRHVSQNMMVDLTGTGSSGGDLPLTHLEPGQEWQVVNVLDLPVVTALCRRILGDDKRMSSEAQTVLSQGIQQYLKNMAEFAAKTSKSRTNRASHNSYDVLTRMIIEHGKGYVHPDNQHNIGMKWGPDVKEILTKEEMEARRTVKEYNVKEEEALREEMTVYDEERGKLQQGGGTSGGGGGGGSNKRKAEVDPAWWIQDDAAEKAGALSLEELSRVHFKVKVAQKYQLGMHQPTKKKLTKAAREELQQQQQQLQQQQKQQQAMQVDQHGGESGGGVDVNPISSSSSSNAVLNWANQPCPLKLVQRNLITVDDIEHTIAHTSFAKSAVAGIGCSLSRDRERVGSHIQRWRLGLDLHQLIEK